MRQQADKQLNEADKIAKFGLECYRFAAPLNINARKVKARAETNAKDSIKMDGSAGKVTDRVVVE